jgi:hypothetical protein
MLLLLLAEMTAKEKRNLSRGLLLAVFLVIALVIAAVYFYKTLRKR